MSYKNFAIALTGAIITITSLASSENDFSRQWGAMGTLHQAPTYFKPYVPKKHSCHKKQPKQMPAKEVPAAADQKKA